MDYRLEQWINAGAGANAFVDRVMVALAQWSEVAFIALVAGWFLVGLLRRSRVERSGAVAALLASGAGLLLAQAISSVWARPRPFVTHPGSVRLLVAHTADASLPSDHVTAAVAIAGVLFLVHRRLGVLALLVAAVVGYARIFAGVHYPGDVLAGMIVGTAAAALLGSQRSMQLVAAVDRWVSQRLPGTATPGSPPE